MSAVVSHSLRYPTPLADAARAKTRQMMRTHLRSRAVELAVAFFFFGSLGFAVACQI